MTNRTKAYPCCGDLSCPMCHGEGVVYGIENPVIVYVVMTDSPSRGGSLYTVKATREEAEAAVAKLSSPGDAFIYPWRVGSEQWDADYVLMLAEMRG